MMTLVLGMLSIGASTGHPRMMTSVSQADTTKHQRTVIDTNQVDTLHNVVIKPKLEMKLNPNPYDIMPHKKGLSDIIPGSVTDRILHPFAIKQRKREKHKKKMMKVLRDYDHIADPNEQLREALRREGIDPDSLKARQQQH